MKATLGRVGYCLCSVAFARGRVWGGRGSRQGSGGECVCTRWVSDRLLLESTKGSSSAAGNLHHRLAVASRLRMRRPGREWISERISRSRYSLWRVFAMGKQDGECACVRKIFTGKHEWRSPGCHRQGRDRSGVRMLVGNALMSERRQIDLDHRHPPFRKRPGVFLSCRHHSLVRTPLGSRAMRKQWYSLAIALRWMPHRSMSPSQVASRRGVSKKRTTETDPVGGKPV